MNCNHSRAEKLQRVEMDGVCPSCLRAKIERLTLERDQARWDLDEARSALREIQGCAGGGVMSHELKEGVLVAGFCYEQGTNEGPGVIRMQPGQMGMVPWIEDERGVLHNCAKLAWIKRAALGEE